MHVKTECVNTDDEVNYILQLCEGPIDKQVKKNITDSRGLTEHVPCPDATHWGVSN